MPAMRLSTKTSRPEPSRRRPAPFQLLFMHVSSVCFLYLLEYLRYSHLAEFSIVQPKSDSAPRPKIRKMRYGCCFFSTSTDAQACRSIKT
jgi:hypothetical protein